MPKSKKKFIDRKSAVTFNLVHRSQQDPLVADESAPQHVLVAVPEKREKRVNKEDKTRKEEQKKFGVFYEDDYNYLQHLRDANTLSVEWEPVERYRIQKSDGIPTKLPGSNATAKLQLPSSVFASEVEEDVGLLNRAAPQSGLRLELDPDVIAAMDEDFNFSDPENELEDNFMEMANAEEGDSEYEDCSSEEGDVSSGAESEDEDDVESMDGPQHTFAEEETKTRFTNYSMSSSVMRRTEQLSILDSRFEKMYEGYDDAEIGALDCDEIEGHVAPDDAMILQMADQFKRDRATMRHETDKSMLNRYLETLHESDNEGEDDLVNLEIPVNAEDRWDCKSILSTYSNIYNHPKLIAEPKGRDRIRISGRTGMPLDVLDGKDGKLTVRALAKLDASTARLDSDEDSDDDDGKTVMSTLSLLSIRPKDETPADRLERKKALKEYRKERRVEKKASALAFKEEIKRQEKVLLNNKRNQQRIHMV